MSRVLRIVTWPLRMLGRLLLAGLWLRVARRRARQEDRLIPQQEPSPRAELVVTFLLWMAAFAGAGFVAVYVVNADTQFLGLSIGLAFAFLSIASIITAKKLMPDEQEVEIRRDLRNLEARDEIVQYVEEGGSRIARKGVLVGALAAAGSLLAAALIVPLGSMGPFLGTDRALRTPWKRGRRLVDESGAPIPADSITTGSFLTAFAEGAPKDTIGAPIIVCRVLPDELRLPPSRRGWAPGGILAFSKICPHAACAISMFRYPLFPPHAPGPALVCPCHYSTFDPTQGGKLVFGPAGRALPQLPLYVDRRGNLRAAGGMSGAVGPSWWGVRYT